MMKKNQISILLISLFFFKTSFSQNNALNFDGVDDYVNLNAISSALENSTDFTIEFWMKADLNTQSSERVVLFSINRPAPSGDNEFLIIMGGVGTTQEGKIIIYDQNSTGNLFNLVSSTVIGDNKCHHIAYVRNGSSGEVYIDGSLIGTHVVNYNFGLNFRYSLGQEWDGTTLSDFYNGDMDEVRIWNSARTGSQIQNNMNSVLTGNETDLLAYYDFTQGVPGGNNANVTSLTDRTS